MFLRSLPRLVGVVYPPSHLDNSYNEVKYSFNIYHVHCLYIFALFNFFESSVNILCDITHGMLLEGFLLLVDLVCLAVFI